MATYPEKLATHILFFGIFLVTFLTLGLYLGIPILKFDLPIAYAAYLLCMLVIKLKQHQKIQLAGIIPAIVIPILFLGGTYLLARTYDFTFDGQNYHQTAVISLANDWNPIRDSQLTIPAPTGLFGLSGEFSKPFVVGYPKALWLIQSSIYKFTGHINSAVTTNLLAGLVTLVLLAALLLRLGLTKPWAFFSAILGILGTNFIQQFLAFTADGFSYEMSIIAIVSLISLAMDKDKSRPLIVFICSWLFLIGTKYSNAYIGLALALVCIVLLARIWFRSPELHKPIGRVVCGGVMLAAFILSNPFAVNLYRYGSPVYPDNFSWATDNVKTENIPHNLSSAGKLELLFYGIYSHTQIPSDAGSPQNIAQLKIPFTVSANELSYLAAAQPSERVADAGVLFSGLFTLSLIILLSLFLFDPSPRDELVLWSTSCIIVLIFVCSLALPTPNVFRYTPLITFVPVLTLMVMLMIDRVRPFSWLRIAKFVLAGLIIVNTGIFLFIVGSSTLNETRQLNQQFASMRESGLTYNVYAPGFYSSYIRMQEAGVKIIETSSLGCTHPTSLDYTYGQWATLYCPVQSK